MATATGVHRGLFECSDGAFVPTPLAGSPWGSSLVGGGPTAGLLAHAVETLVADPEMFVARLTVDLERPVPSTPLRTEARVVRPGRKLMVVEAVVTSEGSAVARAVAHVLRLSPVQGAACRSAVSVPGPEGLADGALLPPPDPAALRRRAYGYHDVVGVRWVSTRDEPGPSVLWMATSTPIIAGEPTTPLMKVASFVDFISSASPPAHGGGAWINSDVTLYLQRSLEGAWLGISTDRVMAPRGIGVATAALFDAGGRIGTAVEALLRA